MKDFSILMHWVREREAIRVRKEVDRLPFPWTDDPILRTYRFCCVRREDDRVTVWIRKNIREPFAGSKHLWLMLCIARMINWPDTLEVLTKSGNRAWPVDDAFTPSILGEVLEGLATFKKVFTGAYIIPAPTKGKTKGKFIAEEVIGQLWKDHAKFETYLAHGSLGGARPTMRETHFRMLRYNYWGPFLAYQADKYMRVRNKEGTPRALYVPGRGS